MTIDEKITRKGYLEMQMLQTGKSRQKVSKIVSMVAYDHKAFKELLRDFRMEHGRGKTYAKAHEINKHRHGRAKNLNLI